MERGGAVEHGLSWRRSSWPHAARRYRAATAAHVSAPMQRTVPSTLTSLRHQRGYNRWRSPWVVAIADPRASETYTWPANADRAKEGCYTCRRPENLAGRNDVYENFTNGRLLKAPSDILTS